MTGYVKDSLTKEDSFTSTGVKFWKHKDSMQSYMEKTGHSIISTHTQYID